jgi:hypothetical protein
MRNLAIFLLLPLLFAGCFSVATQDDLQAIADGVKQTEHAIIDALPLPVPKEPTKELIGWLSDILILGGGAGAAGIGGKKVLNKINGKKPA